MGMPALSAPSAAAMAKTLKRSPVTFPFKEENNMVLVNLMEELVINKMCIRDRDCKMSISKKEDSCTFYYLDGEIKKGIR